MSKARLLWIEAWIWCKLRSFKYCVRVGGKPQQRDYWESSVPSEDPLILHWEGFVLALPSSWNLNKQPLNVCCHCRSSFNQTSDDTLSVLVCFLSLRCCAVTLVTLPVPAALSGACGCSLFSDSCIHFPLTTVYEILESSSVTWTVCTCFESNWTSLPFHGFFFFFGLAVYGFCLLTILDLVFAQT